MCVILTIAESSSIGRRVALPFIEVFPKFQFFGKAALDFYYVPYSPYVFFRVFQE
jgi:hypothetical protein